MSTGELQAAPLTFERFWAWLNQHRSCVVRAGTPNFTLFDYDDFHWDFFEEDDVAICQMIRGKHLVGEVVVNRQQVLFVQASPDHENPQDGHWMFELISGEGAGKIPVAFFVMSHGIEATQGHQQLKH
ncbi:MAG: serine/threonine protein kinase [Myxococcaceae bacterium]